MRAGHYQPTEPSDSYFFWLLLLLLPGAFLSGELSTDSRQSSESYLFLLLSGELSTAFCRQVPMWPVWRYFQRNVLPRPSECKIVFRGHKWISEYIWDAQSSPNEYSNIFRWLRIVRMNIWIYLGGKTLYEWMSEYIQLTENDRMYSEMNIFGWKYLNYDWIQLGNIQSLMYSFFTTTHPTKVKNKIWLKANLHTIHH